MPLSPEISALVHHVELNEAGWWDHATDRLVMAVLWLAGRSASASQIQSDLLAMGIELPREVILEAVSRLESSELVHVSGDTATLAESAIREIEDEVNGGKESERAAQAVYEDTLARHDLVATLEWEEFNETVLRPLVDELGAETYSLLTGTHDGKNPSDVIRPFLDDLDDTESEPILAAIVDFLDPRRREVRDYVLRHLSAAFVARATSLTDETLKALQQTMGAAPRFEVFVDTNFLFSLLELHDNPANEVAQEILRIVSTGSDYVNVALRVLPITLDEARHALVKAKSRCGSLVLRANIGTDLHRVSLGGLEKKFVEQAQSGGTRSAERYFDSVIDNLRTIADDAGIIFHNADTGGLSVDETVATDVVEHLEFERRLPRPKSYEQVQHDIVLWHYARSRRPSSVENPVEAGYWIATADYRFIRYDAHRSERQHALPICIDPASFLQILRFWIPLDEALRTALAGSIRVLFAFQDFDKESERATLRVLEAMSRLEDAPYIRPETSLKVVLNRELRRRIADTDDADEAVQLVASELAKRESELEDEIGTKDITIRKAEEALSATRDALEAKARELEESKKEAEESAGEVKRLSKQVTENDLTLSGLRRRQELIEVVGAAGGLAILIAGACLLALWLASPGTVWRALTWGVGAVLYVEGVLSVMGRRLTQPTSVASWLISHRGRLLAAAIALAVGVLTNWLWSVLNAPP